jgi:hypothetical protein
MIPLFLAATLLSSLSVGGEIRAEDGDYVSIDFVVPAGTVEIHIATEYPEGDDVLDWGVWAPEGMRGWSGGLRDSLIVGVEDSTRGYMVGPITPGTWTLVIGKAAIESEFVTWSGTIEFYDAATMVARPRQATEPVVLEDSKRWYAGDFHVHTSESGDAPATIPEIYTRARQQGLDFIVISDHNTISGHGLQASAQTDMSDLLLIRGNEVTTYGGHGNAMGVGGMIDHRVGFGGRTPDDILSEVKEAGGLFAVNHPNLGLLGNCIGCGWEHEVDWSKVSAMEVHNGNYDVSITIFTPGVIELWEERLSEGHRLAAIGGSDDHRAGIDLQPYQSPVGSPTTWVLADSLSEADILRGVDEGRTWLQLAGPNSPVLGLTLASPDGSVGTIGDTLRGHALDVNLVVSGAHGMQAALFRDGVRIESKVIEGDEDSQVSLLAEVPEEGARFHVEITDGLTLAITSHFYADYAAPPKATGGGCQTAADYDYLGLGLLLAYLWIFRRRSRLLAALQR